MLKRTCLPSLIFVYLTLFSVSGWATSVSVLETCTIDESLNLSEPTQILCASDLKIAPGVTINAGQNGLQIFAVGRLEIGKDFKVVSEANVPQLISFYARTASGQPQIDSTADVEMEFGSVASDYQQSIKLSRGAEVRMFVAGQALQLAGPENKILR